MSRIFSGDVKSSLGADGERYLQYSALPRLAIPRASGMAAPSLCGGALLFGFRLLRLLIAHIEELQRWRRRADRSSNKVMILTFVFLLCGALGVGMFLLSKRLESTSDESTVTTLENVDFRIKNWVTAFPDFFAGGRIEEEHRSDMYFAYHLIFADGYGVAVSRNKDKWNRFITLAAGINLGENPLTDYNNLSDEKKNLLIRDLGVEISKAGLACNTSDPSKRIIVGKDIPIDNTLTDVAFYDRVRQIHSGVRLIMGTIDKLLAEAMLPSSTPDRGASPR